MSAESQEKLKISIQEFFKDAHIHGKPQTLPMLADWINWPVRDIINYPTTGKYSAVINKAKLKCENWLMEEMFRGRIPKEVGSMMMKEHFGYGSKDAAKAKQALRSISQVLDEIEEG